MALKRLNLIVYLHFSIFIFREENVLRRILLGKVTALSVRFAVKASGDKLVCSWTRSRPAGSGLWTCQEGDDRLANSPFECAEATSKPFYGNLKPKKKTKWFRFFLDPDRQILNIFLNASPNTSPNTSHSLSAIKLGFTSLSLSDKPPIRRRQNIILFFKTQLYVMHSIRSLFWWFLNSKTLNSNFWAQVALRMLRGCFRLPIGFQRLRCP